MSTAAASKQRIRFKGNVTCPVCKGTEDAERGQGTRCHGYQTGGTVHCSREDHAGKAPFVATSRTYAHRSKGPCPCGTEHAPADKQSWEIDKVYKYHDADGKVAHETVRFKNPKRFRQRRPGPNGKPISSLDGVKTVLYHLPELLTADPARTVWIVEGEKDVDRLRALGEVATCNPMGAGKWRDYYADALIGRIVRIIEDNDQPGRDHAQEVAQSLQGKALSVSIVRLPGLPEKGDVSDFLDGGGKLDQLIALGKNAPEWTAPVGPQPSTNGHVQKIEVNEAVDDPHRLARRYQDTYCNHQDGLTVRYHRSEFLQWENGAYRPVPMKEINAQLNHVCKDAFDDANKEAIRLWQARGECDEKGRACPCPLAKKVGTKLIGDVNQALGGMTLLKSSIEPPAWLMANPPFDPREVIPCQNALVHLPSLTAGQTAIVPPTPLFFGTFALNYDFDVRAAKPVEWLKFLDSVWGADPGDPIHKPADKESIATLQEWFGYCLTQDTRQQKILELIGPKRAGKDTIARILRALIGPENVAGPTLSSLATNFGLWPLIGKPLAVISDARLSGRSDIAVIVERLLTISGEGTLTIDRKNLEPWTGKLPTRLVLISNELPHLTDSSGALVGRLILLRLTRTFYGKEDKGLFDRLARELPGILLWAIEGWRRLNDRGHFLQPKSGKDMIEQMEDLSSPVGAFVRDRCVIGVGKEVTVKDLFEGWQKWCESIGRSRKEAGHAQSFGKHFGAAFPQIRTMETRRKDSSGTEVRARVYVGIDLKTSF